MMAHRNIIDNYAELLAVPAGDNEYAFYPHAYRKQWKIHLCLNPQEDVYPDLNEPLIRDVSRFLIEEKKVNHKFANGGDGFKTYTIYTGSMEDTLDLALHMKERFAFPTTDPDLESSDMFLADGIYMRFEGQPDSAMFMRYGHKSIPAISTRYDYSQAINPHATPLNKSDKRLIHSLAGHVFCARHYGENYLGQNYDDVQWDKGIFESLGQNYDPQFLKSYIELTCRMAESFCNSELKTANPIYLDIDTLIKPRTQTFQNNITSIMNKWDKNPSASPAPLPDPADDILGRYQQAKNKDQKKHNPILRNIMDKF
jgi:hypothetical protein